MLNIDGTHTMDDYMDILNTSTKIYIDDARLRAAVDDAYYKADDFKLLVSLSMSIESGGVFTLVEKDRIIDYLCALGIDLDSRFSNRRTKSYSLDRKKVVEPLIEAGIEVELLKHWIDYRSYLTYGNFLRKLCNETPYDLRTSSTGRIIRAYSTTLEERENLRIYYKKIAVVSIPKRYSSIITVPNEEYHLAWCDYPQADWRFAYNLFIQDDTNRDIMRNCEDAYEGLARIIEGEKFDPETFKTSRKAYKVDCLKVFYNSRDNNPIPTAMRNYFRSRTNYARYYYDLSVLYRFKLPVPCESYFGFSQNIPEGKYQDEFLSKGLNTPIQTFTSHVVNETVILLLHRFWDLGYTKDDINVYFVRHDEPLFVFKDTILRDAWIFKDCSEIHIDGFTPIRLDFHFGNFYQEEDPGLTSLVTRHMNARDDMLHTYLAGVKRPYSPTPKVENLYALCEEIIKDGHPAGYNVFYYDLWSYKLYSYTTEQTSREDALSDTATQLVVDLGGPLYLLISEAECDFMNSVGPLEETLMKVVRYYSYDFIAQINNLRRKAIDNC